MGCFSISCGLSNLPIYGDEIGMCLLKKHKLDNSNDIKLDKSLICSNEGAMAFFEPVSPILYGSCDTYGRIEDIENQKELDWTCNMLGLKDSTEESFTDFCDGDRMNQPSDGYYLTFFLKDVVQKAIKFERNRHSLFKSHQQHWVLERFPDIFKFEGEDESLKRYNLVYSVGDKKIYSDGEWINLESQGIYKTKDLLDKLNNKSISDTILNAEVETRMEYELDQYLNSLENNELYKIYPDMARFKYGMYSNIDYKTTKGLKKEFCDLLLLSQYMFAVNRFFFPVFSGPQYNDYENIDHLLSVSQDYSGKIKRERELDE